MSGPGAGAAGARRVGVEEEFLLVDPATGAASPSAPGLVAAAPGALEPELQREQVETGSAPHRDADALLADLRARRRRAAAAAARAGAQLVALGTHPQRVRPRTTPGERYERIVERFGALAAEQLTCGCHVHVEIGDREEGVGVLDRIGPWLPVLLALSANSPFWRGEDTGYASWRSQVWGRWPSAGPAGPVGTAARHDELRARLLATGVLLDEGMVYADARLSAAHPTVEVRVADVCLRAEDAALLARLVRALVERAAADARAGLPVPDDPPQLLRLTSWRAARDGVDGQLVSPATGRPAPAAAVVAELVEHVRGPLAGAGDLDAVRAGTAAVLARGSGARWQRQTARGAGLAGLVRAAAEVTLA
ncbi:carboxylate-amine ligase [Kineococcus terrestris]|uniref:carboxylate-amine ligase n=1 Tax=Kineococcus terrestris TaxID=2044856 RepID=UPI0034DB5569